MVSKFLEYIAIAFQDKGYKIQIKDNQDEIFFNKKNQIVQDEVMDSKAKTIFLSLNRAN